MSTAEPQATGEAPANPTPSSPPSSAPSPSPSTGSNVPATTGGGGAPATTGTGRVPATRSASPSASPSTAGANPTSTSAPFNPTDAWDPPKTTGVFEVDPEELWAAATQIETLREGFLSAAQQATSVLTGSCFDMAGKDFVGMFFASLYDPITQDMVNGICDLMASLGGVPEGLITTANNYAAADAASTPGGSAQHVAVPAYGAVSLPRPAQSSDHGYLDIESFGGNPGFVAIKQIADPFQFLMDFFPRGHQDRLTEAASALEKISSELNDTAQALNDALASITVDSGMSSFDKKNPGRGKLSTNQVNTWREAMIKYCNRIWGNAAWGTGGLPDHPLGLIGKCADELAKLCHTHIDAINQTRSALEERLVAAGAAAVLGALLAEETFGIAEWLAEEFDFDCLMDCARILVAEYYQPIEQAKDAITALSLRSELEKALAAAPTMSAIEAQSEQIGDRALHDFTYPGLTATPPTTPNKGQTLKRTLKPYSGRTPTNLQYPVDLAGQEGTDGAHVIDNHVGKTDEQLVQRMADKNPEGSSSFTDLGTAQNLVQQDLSNPTNSAKITQWIANIKNGTVSSNDTCPVNLPMIGVTGRTVVDQNGSYVVTDAHDVTAVLKYDANLSPPFVVSTAYPS